MNHTHLHELNHSLSLSLPLSLSLLPALRLLSDIRYIQNRNPDLQSWGILWNVAQPISLFRDMWGEFFFFFFKKGKLNIKPVWMHEGISAVTGRGCVITASSFSQAVWFTVSSNPYSMLYVSGRHNQQPLVCYSVCLTCTTEVKHLVRSWSTAVKSKCLDRSLTGLLKLPATWSSEMSAECTGLL